MQQVLRAVACAINFNADHTVSFVPNLQDVTGATVDSTDGSRILAVEVRDSGMGSVSLHAQIDLRSTKAVAAPEAFSRRYRILEAGFGALQASDFKTAVIRIDDTPQPNIRISGSKPDSGITIWFNSRLEVVNRQDDLAP